ncbi:MAG TPA: hypothetical protein ENO22_07550 [candidate division Zixibacteria bacterium]|nr:hypothetical protein [candidate division Zixibacteria bacterium]
MKQLLSLPILLLLILLSCSDSDNLDVVLVDNPSSEAGEYTIIWDQHFENGAPVPEGVYRLDMDTDNFQASLYFEIAAFDTFGPFAKTVAPGNSLKPIPDSYGLRISKQVFNPGETVEIGYDLPQTDRIRLTVSWINLDISPL